MNIENNLFKAAVDQAVNRYPSGWAGAAAICTQTGKIITSIAPDVNNDSLSLCMEVGALLEANRLNESVSHSLCVAREDENSDFIILSPCGICRERLAYWGGDVQVAVTNPENSLIFKSIKELVPYHWLAAYNQKL